MDLTSLYSTSWLHGYGETTQYFRKQTRQKEPPASNLSLTWFNTDIEMALNE